ncbi:hypothetical protein [Streptomyces sp. TR06-5]|uniref:hypothetical protein n=1 Tax=unclassified Streptomyces TaxID=2593676 RepID=UPI00399FF40C
MSAVVDPVDVLERIGVSAPYYALENVTSAGPGLVRASVPVQCPPGRQVSPIGLSEAGRHLAIAGLCAAATAHPLRGRHYYLAREVVGRSVVPDSGCDEDARWLRARAGAEFGSKRRARAHTELLHMDGTPLLEMHVEYDVLSERVFRRMFDVPEQRVPEQRGRRGNPYTRLPEVEGLKATGTNAVGSVRVGPEACRGHFEGFPAMPVAITGGALVRLLDAIVTHDDPEGRWVFHTLRLAADHLPPAGERIELSARSQEVSGRRLARCEAVGGGHVATTMEIGYTLA